MMGSKDGFAEERRGAGGAEVPEGSEGRCDGDTEASLTGRGVALNAADRVLRENEGNVAMVILE